jgi:two-component system sensor histidine kinase KdpD
MRTALLSAVSHDLRGPLASALASVASLRNESVNWTEDNRRELLETAASSLDRLKALIENLLDMSRLQAGAMAVHLQDVSLFDVIPGALKSIGVDMNAIQLIDSVEISEVRTDPGLLERVIANLIDNALSHGKSIRKPCVAISQYADDVQLRIIDYGPGIDPALSEVAFAPFKKLGDVDNQKGIGLGLALSHGLAVAIGADLLLEPTPGGGLTAIITLPSADTTNSDV